MKLSPELARQLARNRVRERDHIAHLSDPDLAAYLGEAVTFGARVSYRAAWHEATVVRHAIGIPKY